MLFILFYKLNIKVLLENNNILLLNNETKPIKMIDYTNIIINIELKWYINYNNKINIINISYFFFLFILKENSLIHYIY